VLLGAAAEMEVLQEQFRISERAPADVIRAGQHTQIGLVAAHAYATSGFWRERLEAAGFGHDGDWFARLPMLTRGEVKAAGPDAYGHPVPPGHGEVFEIVTSGSTGTPLAIAKTELAVRFWNAITLRDSLWRGRDLRGKLAVIRVGGARGVIDSWGAAYAGYSTGPCVQFDARDDTDSQLDWLHAETPAVLLTHASNLRALAVRSLERNLRLPGLTETRSYSEQLPPDLAELVGQAWNVGVSDLYSANEVGYVALGCPDSGLYHIQAEDVLVEIIGDDGKHCGEGEPGRVVVTSLHNFAMPLLRYELGDYATTGPPCTCGRTLPTIERILGRTRNMLRLPGGRTAFPGFPMGTLLKLPIIRQVKFIQHSLSDIELELVLERPLTDDEQSELRAAVCRRLQHPFNVVLTRVESIVLGRSYKREDFECRMA
jgi:phenylacetate-CoA ligase